MHSCVAPSSAEAQSLYQENQWPFRDSAICRGDKTQPIKKKNSTQIELSKRFALLAVGRDEIKLLNQLLVGALGVMRQVPVLSPQTWQAALLCPDGQIHDAASKLRCISVSES